MPIELNIIGKNGEKDTYISRFILFSSTVMMNEALFEAQKHSVEHTRWVHDNQPSLI